MNDSTQRQESTSAGAAAEKVVAGTAAVQQPAGVAQDDGDDRGAGSGVPGGGHHTYASGKTYCGTEN